MHDFEELDGVVYEDITKLYWNFYPYKVNLTDMQVKPLHRGRYDSNASLYERNKKEWKNYLDTRMALYEKMVDFCNEHLGIEWTSKNNDQTLSFFFRKAEDAQQFIREFRSNVNVVFRPENLAAIDALGKNRTLIQRETLWYANDDFGGYRHYVEFKHQKTKEDEAELDDSIAHLFNDEPDAPRYMYVHNLSRRLYLNRFDDILYVKLGVDNDKIKGYYSILLKSDLK